VAPRVHTSFQQSFEWHTRGSIRVVLFICSPIRGRHFSLRCRDPQAHSTPAAPAAWSVRSFVRPSVINRRILLRSVTARRGLLRTTATESPRDVVSFLHPRRSGRRNRSTRDDSHSTGYHGTDRLLFAEVTTAAAVVPCSTTAGRFRPSERDGRTGLSATAASGKKRLHLIRHKWKRNRRLEMWCTKKMGDGQNAGRQGGGDLPTVTRGSGTEVSSSEGGHVEQCSSMYAATRCGARLRTLDRPQTTHVAAGAISVPRLSYRSITGPPTSSTEQGK